LSQPFPPGPPTAPPAQKSLSRRKPLLLTFLILGFVIILFILIVLLGFSSISKRKASTIGWGEKVGVVKVEGIILKSQPVIDQLHRYKKNRTIKAVVLRVDSPGGAVGPAQEIFEEVKRLSESKPVVVSMGSVAASGAYYISAPASWLIANPGTITGSIGVVMDVRNLEDLLSWMKIKHETIKSGQMKDIGSPYREMTDEERAHLQGIIQDVHQQFEQAVAEGRKLDMDKVHVLADGRIFTGRQALGQGLVDQLGNLPDAINKAAELAGIKGEPEVVWPPRKRPLFWGQLLEGLLEQAGKDLAQGGPVRLLYLWR
jgi:protease-4